MRAQLRMILMFEARAALRARFGSKACQERCVLLVASWFVIAPIAADNLFNAHRLSLAAFAAVCSSTSPPGGNQVDGLPPDLSLKNNKIIWFFKIVKIKNVVKTNGGSTISKRSGYNNQCHDLRPDHFSCVRVRIMQKNKQGPSGGDRSEGSTIIFF